MYNPISGNCAFAKYCPQSIDICLIAVNIPLHVHLVWRSMYVKTLYNIYCLTKTKHLINNASRQLYFHFHY